MFRKRIAVFHRKKAEGHVHTDDNSTMKNLYGNFSQFHVGLEELASALSTVSAISKTFWANQRLDYVAWH